ncbi:MULTISPECIES: serine--tRNA ligase [Brevibacterium]|uniref:Serine--tRNA ligase n=2 Tax=Bacteria TaxID=2 RepID=A0A165DG62_9MICO|nr:serine--tRNA ligase [Brevibacterium casei]NJE67482.1 serine--tRNA ligase [Brevibacterium sp. LS14]SIJ36724.1 seryl-tRNA synthetase [Mycobacteroides abscessus subsp. abscessus]KZE14626.1 serine--tRNA ligase [Brevibacterium casei]MBE4694230.1 serine--tRNA ligase [Brevibacterium casei]MBY3577353.1 serine--tRNA ligase [Brevibacterium casei]
MIDLVLLREDPDLFKASQKARGASVELVDEVLAADSARRAAITAFEDARADQKAFSSQIAKASKDEKPALIAEGKEKSAKVKALQAESEEASFAFESLAAKLPNLIIDGIPSGGEENFVTLKTVGQPRDFAAEGFAPLDHLALGEELKAIDTARGTKVSGARFHYLTGFGAKLEMALLNLARDVAEEAGFSPTITPTLVKPEVMRGTGFLGEHADEVYRLEADDLFLVGTSEVPLAGYYMDEIIDLSDGPLRFAGISSCYRREAGSYGKDTRGIIRVHQFQKVEMFSYVEVEDAEAEHERMLSLQEKMLQLCELPYRVIDVAAGDLGDSAARKYDCEAWVPTQETYRELTSTSNCTTFQARRLQIRERHDGATRPVATLNGTMANTRWLVAILENHQQADGSVTVPEALRPYLGGMTAQGPEGPRF